MSCRVCKDREILHNGVDIQTYVNAYGELETYYHDGDVIEVEKHKINFCPNCGADLRMKHKISDMLRKHIYKLNEETLNKEKCEDIIKGRVPANEDMVRVAKLYLKMIE